MFGAYVFGIFSDVYCILYLSYMFDIGSAMYDSKLQYILITYIYFYIYICSYYDIIIILVHAIHICIYV